MARTPPSRVSTSRILADLRLASRKGDRSALTLALDQMRTLAHSPRYWERYLGLLRNPLARLVDLLSIKQGERIAHQKGWKLPRPAPAAAETKARRGGKKTARRGGAARTDRRRCSPRSSSDPRGRRRQPGGGRRPDRAALARSCATICSRHRPRRSTGPPPPAGSTAIDLARAAADAGAQLVVAVGGDGTLNEVVNGVTRETGPSPDGGRGAHRPRVRRRAQPRAVRSTFAPPPARLVQGVDARFDLVRGEWPDGTRRYVITAAGAGFDAAVARRAGHRRPAWHAAVRAARSSRRSPRTRPCRPRSRPTARVAWAERLSSVVVANGAYYGGGMKIAPAADPADGHLDLVVLGDLGRLELLWWLPTVYRGAHLACPKVVTHRARRVTIRAASPLPVHVDGEAGRRHTGDVRGPARAQALR